MEQKMNDNLPQDWAFPDFSPLKEIAKSIEEMMRPVAETMLRFQEMMRPIIATIESLKPNFDGLITGLAEATRTILVVNKLGDAQFVYWSHIKKEFIEDILSSNNINKTLRKLFVLRRVSTVDNTIKNCRGNSSLARHMRLFDQSIIAFRCGQSDLAVIGFTSIIDGLLTDISGNHTTKIATRAAAILDKMEKNESVDSDEYALLTLIITFQKTLNAFSASSDFSQKEPIGLNRHWIIHGRSRRRKTKLDCIKLINLIYGILLIDAFGKHEATVDGPIIV